MRKIILTIGFILTMIGAQAQKMAKDSSIPVPTKKMNYL